MIEFGDTNLPMTNEFPSLTDFKNQSFDVNTSPNKIVYKFQCDDCCSRALQMQFTDGTKWLFYQKPHMNAVSHDGDYALETLEIDISRVKKLSLNFSQRTNNT